jgi:hypothetical protein
MSPAGILDKQPGEALNLIHSAQQAHRISILEEYKVKSFIA